MDPWATWIKAMISNCSLGVGHKGRVKLKVMESEGKEKGRSSGSRQGSATN
jgi:hypothetical protein